MAATLVVGLTGSLASGKSTILAEFRAQGAATVDADQLARAALAPGSPLLARVRNQFGDAVFSAGDCLDRRALAAMVFADADARRALEEIVHPEVIRREEQRYAELERDGAAIVIADIPLLFEVGRESRFHRVVVAACPPERSLERAIARGMEAEDARSRLASQLPFALKAARADYIIDTSGTLAETRSRTVAVWQRLVIDRAELVAGRPLPKLRP